IDPLFQHNLQSLTLSAKEVCPRFLVYLAEHVVRLKHLTFFSDNTMSDGHFNSMFHHRSFNNAFNVLNERQNRMQIMSLKFDKHVRIFPPLLQRLATWFPALQTISFQKIQLDDLINQDNNILMDFSSLNLRYLYVDIKSIIPRRESLTNKIDLEIMRNHSAFSRQTALLYQKKWGNRNEINFARINSYQYGNIIARYRRLASQRALVLTIRANSINYLHFYSDTTNESAALYHAQYRQKFDQILHLNF
ncbi:hypothetical protein, partial, partial [Parasitella parasitica]